MKEHYFEIIKYSSIVIICICFVINIFSYISLFNLRNTNNNLKNQLNEISTKYEKACENYEYLITNKDEINEEYLREEENLVKKDEIVINF